MAQAAAQAEPPADIGWDTQAWSLHKKTKNRNRSDGFVEGYEKFPRICWSILQDSIALTCTAYIMEMVGGTLASAV